MAKTINGKVYDDKWKYLWHEDIVYGTGPIWKNQEKGLTQNLNSEATINSQPTKDMNAWTGTIKYADPQSPSTNPATRREKYATSTGSTTPENDMLTTIWWYQTTTPTQIETPKFTQTDTTTPTSWIIKDKGSFSYGVQWGDSALELIKKYLEEAGVDATAEMYWPLKTKAVQDYLSSQYALGELMNQQTWILNKQSPNVQRVIDLAEEVAMARALWINDAATIAKQLNQEERVIQKIMNGEANELVQLNQDYVDKQLKDYIRAGEDYTTNIQRNIVQFQNAKQNLDYQFNSAMDTIERQLFDSERAAKTSSAIFWMTGTKYTIDRIRTQYQQQMDDLQNTYDYQSATAQLAINNALEDYSTNMMRLTEDYDEAYKVVQQNVLATMQNLNNQVWLTIKQQSDILTNLQTNVAQMKADALSTYLAWLEAGNQTFSNAIANAYWLDVSGLTSTRTPGGWTYTPTNQATVDWALYSVTSSSKYANENKIRSWQCWTIVNDYLWMLGSWFKISYASDMEKYINYRWTDPMVWSIAYFAPGSLQWMSEDGKKYWHVAIVTWVNKEKWTITVRESNANTWIQDHEYSMSDVAWYFNPMEWYNSASTATSDEIKAAQNIYDADIDMLATVQSFYNAYSKIEDTLDKDISETSLNLWNKALVIQMKLDGINTVWDLFYHATSPDSKRYDQANTMIKHLGNSDLNQAVKAFRQIINKTFITQLVSAKQAWATFWNLTEWEGRRIQDAYNELSATLDFNSMIEATSNLINNLNNDLAYMDQLYWNNITKRTTATNVVPQGMTEQQIQERINNNVWTVTGMWFIPF